MKTPRQAAIELTQDIKKATSHYADMLPNSHLGEQSRQEDIRSAFRYLRALMVDGRHSIQSAIGRLDCDAYLMAEM